MKEHIKSLLRANEILERSNLLYLVVSTLQDVPVCKADVDQTLTEMVKDGTVEVWDEDGGYRYYELAHCGHDTPQECQMMGCQQQYPGVL